MSRVCIRGAEILWELADDQEDCLMCLGRHCLVFGEMPTFVEVADHLKQTVEHTVRVLGELRLKQMIEWNDEEPRSFRVPVSAIEVMAAVLEPGPRETFDDDGNLPAEL